MCLWASRLRHAHIIAGDCHIPLLCSSHIAAPCALQLGPQSGRFEHIAPLQGIALPASCTAVKCRLPEQLSSVSHNNHFQPVRLPAGSVARPVQAVQSHDARALHLSKAAARMSPHVWQQPDMSRAACRLPSRPCRAHGRVRIPQTPYCAHAPTTCSSHTTSIIRCVDFEGCLSTMTHSKPLPIACSQQIHAVPVAATSFGPSNNLARDAAAQ